MRICLFLVIVITSITNLATAQKFTAQPVKGLPSDEVYDLLADSKGFLWAAHGLGLSRYDGVTFKTFSHPLATGYGVTDLVEDKQGRIWCHNFNGQVFYVEDEEMHVLYAYKYKEENFYPRMTVLNDELLITSRKGLFVCNTSNLLCKYLYDSTSNIRTRSIAVVKNKLYEFDAYSIKRYERGKGLKRMYFKDNTRKELNLMFHNLQLQPLATNDNIYAKYNQRELFKFIVKGDTIVLVSTKEIDNFANTIISCNNTIWTNTRTYSYSNKGDYIDSVNLSDIVKDREGNTWYSSLDKGLFIEPKNTYWQTTNIVGLSANDYIRCHLKTNKGFIWCTQLGNIIIKNDKKQTSVKLPLSAGGIEKVFYLSDTEIFIAASNGFFLYDLEKKILNIIEDHTTIKDILLLKDKLYIGVTASLEVLDMPNKSDNQYKGNRNKYVDDLQKRILHATHIKENRCYSLAYNKTSNKLVAAFNDGVFQLNKAQFKPISYLNKGIAGLSLLACDDKIFIRTSSNGLFILRNNIIKKNRSK